MAKLKLSKSSLSTENQNLKMFQRFLPSLDLKRQQLSVERAKAVQALADTRAEIERLTAAIGAELPMLANKQLELRGLVRVTGIDLGEENAMGTRLPIVNEVHLEVSDYGLLSKPHWIDRLVQRLRDVLELRARLHVQEQRVVLLEKAAQIVTQRVNLFDKVLIPRAKKNIKRIRIYLSDNERAAIVNSKISKRKQKAIVS